MMGTWENVPKKWVGTGRISSVRLYHSTLIARCKGENHFRRNGEFCGVGLGTFPRLWLAKRFVFIQKRPRTAGNRSGLGEIYCSILKKENIEKGEPPARVLPLFVCDENSPSPALWKHRGISPSADGDKGLCPLTPLPFLQRSKRKRKEAYMRPAALVSL